MFYKSFRDGDYELKFYGDPDQPAGVEVGAYGDTRDSDEAKANCLATIRGILTDPDDRKLLVGL